MSANRRRSITYTLNIFSSFTDNTSDWKILFRYKILPIHNVHNTHSTRQLEEQDVQQPPNWSGEWTLPAFLEWILPTLGSGEIGEINSGTRNFTGRLLNFHEEKEASIACKIEAVSNLKFLKLLPGPTSWVWESDSGFVGWLSTTVELLPIELCFAFHTQIP